MMHPFRERFKAFCGRNITDAKVLGKSKLWKNRKAKNTAGDDNVISKVDRSVHICVKQHGSLRFVPKTKNPLVYCISTSAVLLRKGFTTSGSC